VTLIHLVRHGRAAAGWDVDPDPALDDIGQRQALAAAETLAALAPCTVVSSPLRRCRETAQPLAERWVTTPIIEPRVAEIPSPEGIPMSERVDWLRAAMQGTWTDMGERYTTYRDTVVAALAELPGDAVVFSHFVAINVVIGAALGDDRLVIRSLDNCSITVVDVTDGVVRLVSGGHEADTLIR
jgi:broad specificity phosphatase PhoE